MGAPAVEFWLRAPAEVQGMPHKAFGLLLLLVVVPLSMAKDKQQQLPGLVVHAKYVFITTYNGDRFDPNAYPDDRQAARDVRDAIQHWGRYIPVERAQDADLILLVRKGRIAEARPGVRIHAGSRPNPNVDPTQNPNSTLGPEVRVDAGDPLDMLAVYDASQGIDSAPLWRGRLQDGLNPPAMRLVQDFRSKVEAAAKKP